MNEQDRINAAIQMSQLFVVRRMPWALLNKNNDYYIKIWNIDYTSKEKQIESQISKILHIACLKKVIW